jgi:hypothetical protein
VLEAFEAFDELNVVFLCPFDGLGNVFRAIPIHVDDADIGVDARFLKEFAKDICSFKMDGCEDDRFGGEDQDATIKANAAREWCKAQTVASGKPWEYWLLLDSDAKYCETFDDISDSAEIE